MRLCRVCLSQEEGKVYQDILSDQCKIAEELFFLFSIQVIESPETPALVCSKCVSDVNNAARLKRIALVADKFFRKQLQIKEFNENDINVKADPELEGVVYAIVEDSELIEYDEAIVESLDEQSYNIIEYDANEIEENLPTRDTEVKEKRPRRKAYAPRQPGGGRQIHQCDCGIIFSSSQRLKNHIRVKHEDVPESELLPCGICGKKFKIQEYLDLHTRNLHSNNPVKQRQKNPCTICGKILSSLVSLKNHEGKHYLENQSEEEFKKFICDFCKQGFRLKSYLFNHIHNVHIRQKYVCPFCQRGFYKKYEMQDHVRQVHTLETPFQCTHEGCPKSFARKKNLLIHLRVHTGERPYACTYEGCDKAFMHFIDRKRHMMKHSGERPHNCKLCPKGFKRKTDLDSHMRCH